MCNKGTNTQLSKKLLFVGAALLPMSALATGGTINLNGANLGEILYNLQLSLLGVWDLLMAACWLFGFVFFTLGLLKLKKYGQMTVFMMSNAELVGPMMRIFVGTMLIYTPWSIEMLLNTVWGSGVSLTHGGSTGTVQGYISSGGMDYQSLMGPVFSLVQVIGILAFIRGLVKLTKVGEQGGQPGTVPAALMLLGGGVLSINIVGTIDVIEATLLGAT